MMATTGLDRLPWQRAWQRTTIPMAGRIPVEVCCMPESFRIDNGYYPAGDYLVRNPTNGHLLSVCKAVDFADRFTLVGQGERVR